jgi:hypothetical protein
MRADGLEGRSGAFEGLSGRDVSVTSTINIVQWFGWDRFRRDDSAWSPTASPRRSTRRPHRDVGALEPWSSQRTKRLACLRFESTQVHRDPTLRAALWFLGRQLGTEVAQQPSRNWGAHGVDWQREGRGFEYLQLHQKFDVRNTGTRNAIRPVLVTLLVVYLLREVGTRLHRFRIERRLTQECLAVAANITSFTYGRLRNAAAGLPGRSYTCSKNDKISNHEFSQFTTQRRRAPVSRA